MSSTAKKKIVVKERGGSETAAAVASVQSAFTSAARATMWHADSNSASANTGTAAVVAAPALSDAQPAYTAATNALCGRPFGATQLENAWSIAEAMPHVYEREKLLPSSPRWELERTVYSRFLTALISSTGAPAQSLVISTETIEEDDFTPPRAADALYEEWLAYVADRRSTPLLYPHHTLLFDATSLMAPHATTADVSSSSAYVQVAAVLHRLLTAYLERCCEQEGGRDATVAEKGVPSRVFASVLYTSVYDNNFSGPAAEQKDATFGSAAPANPTPEKTTAPAGPRRYDMMSVISCLGVSHLCVCVGRHYYKLSVVDDHNGRLRSVGAIASGLEAICRHHVDLRKTDPLPGASPAVHHDRSAMEAMLANLSLLNDEDAFDVRRRLQDASTVNAYSLDTLQAGLCTLVLKGIDDDNTTTEEEPTARWLHSVCSFEVSLRQTTQWQMRLLAVVVPSQAGLEWIARAMALPAARPAAPTVEPTPAEEEKPSDSAAGQLPAAHALYPPAPSTPVGEEGLAEYLELWLPEKHRVPLRPYPVPRWDPETTQTTVENPSPVKGLTVEQFVMSLLRVLVELKQSKSCRSGSPRNAGEEWPRVVLAVQPVCGGAPTLITLDSPAIQHYYQVLAARPLLFAAAAKQRIEAEATEEVRAALNIAWHAVSTVRTQPPSAAVASPSSLWDALERRPADLCVSFTVLPRASTAAPSTAVRRVVSSLALASALLVNCTAQQTAAETHPRASAARVVDAVVQANSPVSVEFCGVFSRALASCKQN
ncbi:hypothetical protein ABB37_01797 [Leptomonas pyrrhocoris]|uniref:Choline/carnitine acyltransferase domain-containing protein n=1 Tax=Leptomonas pyrrhocoris TaxID=157538 RepID=A0A0M9G9F9_LEPPY|nr:hypothetical protein ABB37_01797 [Leptomonas pyrrhocoris]KPA85523.1 hypothetical protein ABB37_01797 [Leptomonas pyrrhocoris]|eukprot:XP_015663962.1 hypothetical protein ABB37_01797 [Leptomonas pyrrhocoris]